MSVMICDDGVDEVAVNLLQKHHTPFYYSGKKENIHKEEVDALLVSIYSKVNKKMLFQFPPLKYVVTVSVGLDHIDIKECNKRDIEVINAPQSNTNSVVEYTITMIFMLMRKILLKYDSVIATPHIAGFTKEARNKMFTTHVKLLLNKLSKNNGKTRVNPQKV